MKLLISKLRKEAGLTIRELAERSGVTKNQISRLETESVDAYLSTICKIARALHVHPCDLVEWNSDPDWRD